jgi:adenine-specific DNA-methyltransferase
MAKKAATKKKTAAAKTVETITHDEAKRKNIPTAEYQSVVTKEQAAPIKVKYPRNTDFDPQLVWRGKDEQDWSDLVVHAPPLYIQEKVHPKVLIDDLLRQTKAAKEAADKAAGVAQQLDLFADFNGVPEGDAKTEFYQHDQNWSNRMILGDSLQVMASLAEREGLRGKVQCIYIDPPYGIKFNSNFQWSTTSRDIKDGNAQHITREPEQVKAFRDTWRDGIHSYLTYLRDRLTIARDLLTDSGSVFVQIGDENAHRIRALMDEVFGTDNFCGVITFAKNSGATDDLLASPNDYLVWFAKNKSQAKYRRPFWTKSAGTGFGERYGKLREANGLRRVITDAELEDTNSLPAGSQPFTETPAFSAGFRSTTSVPFTCQGIRYETGTQRNWKTHLDGMRRLGMADRLIALPKVLYYERRLSDFPVASMTTVWLDTQDRFSKSYVVETVPRVVQRCLLMTTDPGDLVLDPTCGSGTTATVAEQLGRRWITIDTSRVALALARARIMGARYPYYLLADSRDGQQKEAEITLSAPSTQPVHGNIRHGFVYERVRHITLKSIANNAEIDVIWEKWQPTLLALSNHLSAKFGRKKPFEEWEIPREADEKWSAEAKKLHAEWWEARIARQKEIDDSIAAKAEFEYLYDKPYENKKKVRVAGPFTVESLSPHRMLGVDENDELIDPTKIPDVGSTASGKADGFAAMILENLKTAGVQQAHKEDRITFTALMLWPGQMVCAAGTYQEGEAERRAAIFIGPEFGTVQRQDLVQAAREAGDADFDVLIACAFNYEAHATEFSKLGRIPVLKARMNADLHMAEDLKNTGKGNLFVIFGEPDIENWEGATSTLTNEIAACKARIPKCETELAELEKRKKKAKKDEWEAKDQDRLETVMRQISRDKRLLEWAPEVPSGSLVVETKGVDVFHPNTGEVRSDGAEGIACWFIDTDYNDESFFVRHAYFLGQNDPYKSLKTTLKAEINEEAWESLHSDTSRPFAKPKSGKIAVKVINHLGDEVMKVFRT